MKPRDAVYFGKEVLLMNLFPARRVPLSVHIGLTNRCSNRCRYCNFAARPREREWETGELLRVLAEIRAAGGRRVQFTGGEPMLRKDIGTILTRARELGFFAGLSTNGFRVPERVGELRCADLVQVSYDGPPEVHGYLRGERSHAEAVAALDALRDIGVPAWINTVLTTANAGHIGDILEFARGRGITANFVLLDYFRDPGQHFHPALAQIEGLVLKGDSRRSALEELIRLKKTGAPVGGSFPYLENARDWPYENRVTGPEAARLYRCWAGRATAHLEADGMLYSCGMGVGRVPGQDVRELGFAEAWLRLRPLPNCRSCTMACGVEANLLFSLNPRAIRNWLGRV